MSNVVLGYAVDPQVERKEAVRLMRLALRLDDSDPDTLAWAGMTSAYMVGDCERQTAAFDPSRTRRHA
jgi:adenylate cyclase